MQVGLIQEGILQVDLFQPESAAVRARASVRTTLSSFESRKSFSSGRWLILSRYGCNTSSRARCFASSRSAAVRWSSIFCACWTRWFSMCCWRMSCCMVNKNPTTASASGTMSSCSKSQTVFPRKPVQLLAADGEQHDNRRYAHAFAISVRFRSSNRPFHISGGSLTIRKAVVSKATTMPMTHNTCLFVGRQGPDFFSDPDLLLRAGFFGSTGFPHAAYVPATIIAHH